MRRNTGRQFADRQITAQRLAVLVEASPELLEPEAFAAAFEYVTGFRPARSWLTDMASDVERELKRRRSIEPPSAE